MAKSAKQQELEAVQKAAIRYADTVSNDSRTKLVRQVFGKNEIKQFQEKGVKKEVIDLIKKKFDEYLKAAKAFNDARIKSAVAKVNLQRALDRPFVAEKWIAEREHWVIKEIDELKNIIFQEWHESFEMTFSRAVKIASKKGHPTISINKEAWDFADKDIPAEEKAEDYLKPDNSAGTLDNEHGDISIIVEDQSDFLNNLPKLLNDYDKLEAMEDKLSLYRNNLKSDTERELFFEALNKKQRSSLYRHLNKKDKGLVYQYDRED
jgi:hypothetical protein